jgi:hypothetical protein
MHDSRFQYAAHIDIPTDENVYIAPKTYYNFRMRMYSSGMSEVIFNDVTLGLINKFKVDVNYQRIDSTHLRSNMKNGTRLGLLVSTVSKFLKAVNVFDSGIFNDIPKTLTRNYTDGRSNPSNYFADKGSNHSKRSLPVVARDMHELITRFESADAIAQLKEYKLMVKVFSQQCEVSKPETSDADPVVSLKPPKEVGCDSIQYPSDPDATYSAHKGKGYMAQIVETYSETSDENDRPLNLITHVKLDKASSHDTDALVPALEDLASKGIKPVTMLGDTHYGSDENYVYAMENGVNLITPVAGTLKSPKDDGSETEDADTSEANDLGAAEADQPEPMSQDSEAGSERRHEEAGADEPLSLADFNSTDHGQIISCPMGHAPEKFEPSEDGKGGKAFFNLDACKACLRKDVCPVIVRVTQAKLTYAYRKVRIAKRRAFEQSKEFRRTYRWRSGIEATNSQLSRLGIKKLSVRGRKPVAAKVTMKALALNIWRVDGYVRRQAKKNANIV